MPNYRKAIRDAIQAALESGFSSAMASAAAEYEVDFSEASYEQGSVSFFQGYVAPEDLDESQLIPEEEGIAILLYTSVAENQRLLKSSKFSGPVTAHVDIVIRRNTGIEQDCTEDIADAIESAAIEAILAWHAWPSGCIFDREYRVERDPVKLRSDGWQQRIPIELVFQPNL